MSQVLLIIQSPRAFCYILCCLRVSLAASVSLTSLTGLLFCQWLSLVPALSHSTAADQQTTWNYFACAVPRQCLWYQRTAGPNQTWKYCSVLALLRSSSTKLASLDTLVIIPTCHTATQTFHGLTSKWRRWEKAQSKVFSGHLTSCWKAEKTQDCKCPLHMLGEKAKRKERKKWDSLRRKMLNLTTGEEVTDVQAPMEFISGGKELN